MELVIFIGIQASGKSSFYRDRFFDSHVRINLDMLRTRHRERILFEACLEAKQSMVIDNTNPTADQRARYILAARAAGFHVSGYYFQSRIEECRQRESSAFREAGRTRARAAGYAPKAGIARPWRKVSMIFTM